MCGWVSRAFPTSRLAHCRPTELNIWPFERNSRLRNVRIGVLGGTFNPIHLGHLHIAKSIQKIFSLSQVHFVVATTPPHKHPEDLVPFTHRYAMVSLAVAGSSSFIPSMIELEPQASPFSVDTMSKLACYVTRDESDLYFIGGGDSLAEVKTWRESEKLLTSYNFIFAVRPGTGVASPGNMVPEKAAARMCNLIGSEQAQIRKEVAAEKADETRIYIVDVDAPDISATQVRTLVSSGKSVRHMVPRTVCEYIDKLHLYGAR